MNGKKAKTIVKGSRKITKGSPECSAKEKDGQQVC